MDALAVNTRSYNLHARLPTAENAAMNTRQFATPLAALMHARSVSANQLAKATGLPQPTISRIANGSTKEPKVASLRILADYFGVRPDQLRDFGTTANEAEPARYGREQLPALAHDIAKRWLSLSSDRQEWFRDLIFNMAFMEERFPAMRKGRPKGESYTALEKALVQDMHQLKLKFDP